MSWDYFLNLLPILFDGTLVALQIFILTLLFSVPLGMLVAVGKRSRFLPLRLFLNFYISIMRGTPLMLQLIFVYFGPNYMFGIRYDTFDYRFVAAVIAFTINYAAYFAEIFRGGIESMPVGQYEAFACLGYSKTQTFFRIILPQVVKRVLPACSNEVVTLIKDTALAQTIGIIELFSIAKSQANTVSSIMPIVVAGVFYYVMNLIFTLAFGKIEKKLSYYK